MHLRQIVSLWTLTGHPSAAKPWSVPRQLRAIRDAGFDGFVAKLEPPMTALAAELGLVPLGFIWRPTVAIAADKLAAQRDCGAVAVNVHLGNHDTSTRDALAVALALDRAAQKLGIEVAIETHRDTATETPEKFLALADAFQRRTGRLLNVTWDFSHLAVFKHLQPADCAARLLNRPDLVQNATQFHFRPFNGHHAQIPVTHRGQLTPELIEWLGFVREVLRVWKSTPANRGRTLYACPELGPLLGGYALSSFPRSWPETCRLREEIARVWRATPSRAAQQ